ncbi:N-acetylmuramic acid 6-phosphate etherase [Anaerocolumna jejuensis]|uniref:N-acetylmuramic acid 6-phosphate etherase n=1 Tax=Anaerocolumna jejuensis TaxID=259063 RepID=UPI003F7BFD32
MNEYLSGLMTEQVNQNTREIDECSTEQILEMINFEDSQVADIVKNEIPKIAKAVEVIYKALSNGGRMFYLGAGTSGRLGVLDASECPPTFGSEPSLIQGYIAGGDIALRTAVEGYEDSEEEGRNQVNLCKVTEKDVVIGITASGGAAYVLGAVKQARELSAATIGIVNNPNTKLEALCDICIAAVVGPEVIIGSTRMKAGTAQKLILNMLTTTTMIKLGKVYGNMMVDLKASNIKLNERAIRIIRTVTGVDEEIASRYLEEANHSSKTAIMMILSGYSLKEAQDTLDANQGYLKKALDQVKRRD